MAYFPHTITEGNITILFNGSMNKIPRTHAGFNALSEHLKTGQHDADVIAELLDKRSAMARLTAGKVKVVGTTVFYKGEPVHSTLSLKLVTMMDDGYDATPWALFLDNIMTNPSETSRGCLFDFLERFEAPLTEDGCFVAFKGVNDDYSSTRKNPDGSTVWNRPGDLVQKPRDECVEDPNQTCSAGLHVCASHYLDSFWTNKRVIAVKVNPRDVVSVPRDYGYSKMRVCKYLVLGDIEDERKRSYVENAPVVAADPGENRVTAAAPTPLANGYLVPEGWDIDPSDPWPEDGDTVIKPGSAEVGEVNYQHELDIDDSEHPNNPEWIAGDIARNDAGEYILISVNFPDRVESFVNAEGDDCKLRVVYELDDDDDDAGEFWPGESVQDEPDDEPLTFYHEATGQTFTATEVSDIVDDIGQRGFQRQHGVPRTTVQEWLKAIRAAK